GYVVAGCYISASWVTTNHYSCRINNTTRLFSPQCAVQLSRNITPLGTGTGAPGFRHLGAKFNGYALGMGVRDYRGQQMLSHTGGLPGFVSIVAMLPEQRLGVVVLTNAETPAMYPIVWHVFDHYLGVNPIPDYLTFYGTNYDNSLEQTRRALSQAAAARDSTSTPSLPLERYAQTYTDRWYGDIAVEME